MSITWHQGEVRCVWVWGCCSHQRAAMEAYSSSDEDDEDEVDEEEVEEPRRAAAGSGWGAPEPEPRRALASARPQPQARQLGQAAFTGVLRQLISRQASFPGGPKLRQLQEQHRQDGVR